MGGRRPQTRRNGNEKGDKDKKGQETAAEALQKQVDDRMRKLLALVNKPRGNTSHAAAETTPAATEATSNADNFDGSKVQDYWRDVPEGDPTEFFESLLEQHVASIRSTQGKEVEKPEVLRLWEQKLCDLQDNKVLQYELNDFIRKEHRREDSDEGEPSQRRDPLEDAAAIFPSQQTNNQGGSATNPPLDLLKKVIKHPDDLVEGRRRQGRIELKGNVAEHVDRLYPGIKGERYDELCEVDPLYVDLDMDATPQSYVASIHNLYLDLRDSKWLNRDDLLSGLRLALLGRDDVFLSPIDLAYGKSEDSPFLAIKDYKWRQRRFHIVLFLHYNIRDINENHFAVIIGDRRQGRALYYNMMPFTDELFANVKTRYARFLAAIGGPEVALSRGKGPEQTDSNSCGLLVLEAVRHVFREHAGDIAEAGEDAFSVARSMTDILGEGPVSPDEESQAVVAKLRRAWLLCLEKELGGDGERRVALWELPAGGSLPDAASHAAEEFIKKRYPEGFHVLWNKIDREPGRHCRLVVGAVNSTIEQTGFVAHVPKPTVEEIQLLLQADDPTADDVLAAVEKFWAAKGANARIMINESDGPTRPFDNNVVDKNHFILLHVDRGLYFGTRRAVAEPRKNRERKTYPYADDNYVYVVAPNNYLRVVNKSFPTAPESHIHKYRVHSHDFPKELREEKYGGELGEAEKDERADRILEHFGGQFADVPGDNTDPPQQYGPDYMTGLPTHFLPSPMKPDLDAVLAFAMAHGAPRYHSVANTAVMSHFLNHAKGGTRFPADLAIIAEMWRVLNDQTMPWPERKSRIEWLVTALDNMTIIRSYCGFAKKGHPERHAYWEGLSGAERQDILKAFCTGEATGFVRQKLDEALDNGEELLKMRTQDLEAKVSEDDRDRIIHECWLISESHGLSRDDFEELLLLDGTPCPFHGTSHDALRRFRYKLDNLELWIRSSPFYDQCNKNADSHVLYERDISLHWERLLYDVWHTVSKRARAAIDRVALLRPGLRRSDKDFMEEAKYLILDREGLPLSPWVHNPLHLVIATKGPPNTAMFTGFAKRNDGRLPTESPVLHAEPFHPVHSFDESVQNTSPDAGWTNKIMGPYDPSFWPWLFAIFSQIPFEGPYRKIGEGMGKMRLDQRDAQPSGATAPSPSYHDVEVPAPPYDELLGGEDKPVVFTCSACPNDVEFTAGMFQEHLNKEHSVWTVECHGCGLRFPDEDAKAAHHGMNACLGKEGGLGEAASATASYLCCPHHDCKRGPDSGKPFSTQQSLQKHLEAIHTSAEDKELPTIACVCGHFFCKLPSDLRSHLILDSHQKRMNAGREVEEEGAEFYCPECDQAVQTQEQWDTHQASNAHKMTSRCQSQEAGAFRRMTAAEANAPKAETKKTANNVMSRRAAEATVARRGDEWKSKKHTCQPCRYGSDKKSQLTEHKKTVSHLLIVDPDYIAGSEDQSSKAHYCPTCHYGTDRKYHWDRHISSRPHKNKVAQLSTTTNESTDTGSPGFIKAKTEELPSRVKRAILAREPPPRSEKEGCVACILFNAWESRRNRHRNAPGCEKTRSVLAQIDPDLRRAHLKIWQAAQPKRLSTDGNAEPAMSEPKRRKSVDGQKIPINTGDGLSGVQGDGDEDYEDEDEDDGEYEDEADSEDEDDR